ncbi:MAG: rod shape-determining protein RodA, partial [Betaproteobacteria bacterium]|nr:rod shape-determining protein RodA [Betaproteobacteria bacterium]
MTKLLRKVLAFLLEPFDLYLLALLGALAFVGLLTLYSASDGSWTRWSGQVINFAAALVCMW